MLAVATGLGFIAGFIYSGRTEICCYYDGFLEAMTGAVIGFAAALIGLIVFWVVVGRVRSRRRSSASTIAAHASKTDAGVQSVKGPDA
jgi:hypothetical protein